MREMRRSDRMITDREEIVDVLDSCKVFRMAVHDEEGMYIVPLNFGYTYEEDVLKLYFHSAGEGRKVDALAADPKVAIEITIWLRDQMPAALVISTAVSWEMAQPES